MHVCSERSPQSCPHQQCTLCPHAGPGRYHACLLEAPACRAYRMTCVLSGSSCMQMHGHWHLTCRCSEIFRCRVVANLCAIWHSSVCNGYTYAPHATAMPMQPAHQLLLPEHPTRFCTRMCLVLVSCSWWWSIPFRPAEGSIPRAQLRLNTDGALT
jgi:hypothetical protein